MEKKLYRDEYHKKVAGVCAGLSEYFGVDVSVVRLLFVLTCIFHGGGGLVYIILWIVLPKRPYPMFDPTVDYTVPPQNAGAQNTAAPGGNPFGGNPFPNNSFGNNPFPAPPKSNSTSIVAIVIGIILIVVGGSILLDNFDLIPDWDLGHLWPVIPIIIGCALMISGERKKPTPGVDSEQKPADKKDEPKTEDTKTDETNPPADTPPAV